MPGVHAILPLNRTNVELKLKVAGNVDINSNVFESNQCGIETVLNINHAAREREL